MNRFSMTNALFPRKVSGIALALISAVVLLSASVFAQGNLSKLATRARDSSCAAPKLIQPEELTRILQSPKGERPLIFQVGYRVLYQQAHVPHSEYIGPASEPEGIQRLRQRVQGLPRGQ
jgi:hypothetical protein